MNHSYTILHCQRTAHRILTALLGRILNSIDNPLNGLNFAKQCQLVGQYLDIVYAIFLV